ncbi:hypothetical protein B0H15DRAFT_852306 [Mycena belliarum]|uniref:Uncharacterized protein n=1 Tax=Mycena belliarum TaxID=1033014 RepID=A0AAD6TYE2_9AGAR|nr:hypothetical protein B0H15DRAFT_852306 [Mycena belliae]
MYFIATSQPLQDETMAAGPFLDFMGSSKQDRIPSSCLEAPPLDIVGSSQPFDDGEEDLQFQHEYFRCNTPPPLNVNSGSKDSDSEDSEWDYTTDERYINMRARCARLVRRVPQAEFCSSTTPLLQDPIPRPLNLVRRVTTPNMQAIKAAQMERQRQRACEKAHHILKRIRRLATTTDRLRRKHRKLREFLVDNKENTFL